MERGALKRGGAQYAGGIWPCLSASAQYKCAVVLDGGLKGSDNSPPVQTFDDDEKAG
jgi:hypothetical protein